MTVNTLGSESRLGGDAFAPGSSRGSRTVAEWLWPFLVGGVALFSISALFYYHFHRAELEPQSFLQQAFAGLYHTFGWAPSVVFFLLVFAWSLIWFVTGVLEKPMSRVIRLVVMAVMLGVFLNLGDGGVAAAPHKGAFGAWLAGRLVGAVGYVPSLVLVWVTTFASLLLATDWFFSEWFERSRNKATFEVGVEDAVTDHLRGLSEIANRPEGEAAAPATVTVDAGDVPEEVPPDASAGGDAASDADPAQAAPGDGAEPVAAEEPIVHVERRLSYAERRRLRAEREAVEQDAVTVPRPEVAPEPAAESAAGPAAEPEPAEMARAVGSALDELVEQAQAGEAAVTDDELAGLFGAAAGDDAVGEDAAGEDAVIVAPEHVEADEIALVDEVSEVEAAADEVAADEASADEEEAEEVDDEDVEFEEGVEDGDAADEELEEGEDGEELEGDEELEGEDEHESGEEYAELDDDEAEEEAEDDELEDDELEDDELEEEVGEDEEFEEEEYEAEDLDDEEVDDEEVDDEEVDDEEVDDEEADDEEAVDEEEADEEEADEEEVDEEEADEHEVEEELAELDDDEELEEEDVELEEDEDEDDEDESEADDDLVEAVDGEEAVVAIPRPDEAPEPVLPKPPVVPAARVDDESAPAGRQQKLFGGGVDEDLLEEARDLLRSGRRPTASLLQRKLRIDYELAQDLLQELESRGLLAADDEA